ncbi:MAG: hypothetical protein AB7I38_18690 [Dehalococcoidia bacterium]
MADPETLDEYVTEERPKRKPEIGMIAGPIVAHFSVASNHDNFLALLMPLGIEWTAADDLANVLRGIRTLEGEGTRLRAKPVDADAGDAA